MEETSGDDVLSDADEEALETWEDDEVEPDAEEEVVLEVSKVAEEVASDGEEEVDEAMSDPEEVGFSEVEVSILTEEVLLEAVDVLVDSETAPEISEALVEEVSAVELLDWDDVLVAGTSKLLLEADSVVALVDCSVDVAEVEDTDGVELAISVSAAVEADEEDELLSTLEVDEAVETVSWLVLDEEETVSVEDDKSLDAVELTVPEGDTEEEDEEAGTSLAPQT